MVKDANRYPLAKITKSVKTIMIYQDLFVNVLRGTMETSVLTTQVSNSYFVFFRLHYVFVIVYCKPLDSTWIHIKLLLWGEIASVFVDFEEILPSVFVEFKKEVAFCVWRLGWEQIGLPTLIVLRCFSSFSIVFLHRC